jgi:hypothetical protein
MELIPLLSTIILSATIVTILFAAFSYVAYRARDKKPTSLGANTEERLFFRRWQQ